MTAKEREVTRSRLAPGRPTQPEPSVATSSAAFYGLIAPVYDGHWGQAFFSSARTQFRRHIAPRVSRNGRVLIYVAVAAVSPAIWRGWVTESQESTHLRNYW